MTNTKETPQIATLYDNLTPYSSSGDTWVMNHQDGMVFLTVAVASSGGDAGGMRRVNSTPVRLLPGLNRVPTGYVERLEADAQRQRDRSKGGGVLSNLLDRGDVEIIKSLDKTSAGKVATWLAATADLQVVADLREHKAHGPAARAAWDAWHDREAPDSIKVLHHFWRMATNSKKVA
jgi:hypothetical protein